MLFLRVSRKIISFLDDIILLCFSVVSERLSSFVDEMISLYFECGLGKFKQ